MDGEGGESLIKIAGDNGFWSAVIVTLVFVVGTAIAIIAALPTGGTSILGWVAFAGSAALTLAVSGTLYMVTFNITTKIVSDMLGDTYYLSMYEVTPYEIFSDKVLLFDVDFFNPKESKKSRGTHFEYVTVQLNGDKAKAEEQGYKKLGSIEGVYYFDSKQYDDFCKKYGFDSNKAQLIQGEENASANTLTFTWENDGKKYKMCKIPANAAVNDDHSAYVALAEGKMVEDSGKEEVSTAKTLQPIISKWYKTFRNIAIVALLSILVYIGIRITLSSVANDKAKYKQMLVDWIVALCLVFLMHYIMAFSISIVKKINNMLTSVKQEDKSTEELKQKLEKNNPEAYEEVFRDSIELFLITSEKNEGGEDTSKVQNAYKILIEDHNSENNQYKEYFFTDTSLAKNATSKGEAKVLVWPANNSMEQARMRLQLKGKDGEDRPIRYGYAIIYIVLILYTVIFSFTYLRRVVYMAFLTIIAPLVAITYPIDKINDGKAQAFDMWLKEYIFNLLIQPLHLLLYIILINSAMTFASKNIFYVVLALGFFVPAEKLLRRFFGFEKAQTPGIFAGAAGSAVMMQGLNKLMHPKPPRERLGSENNRIKDEDENDNKGPVWRDKEFDPTEKLIEKDESSGNKIINDKLKYDPRLSENQIDELKAEGLEPGDPEYDMYLRNTLGLKPQSEKKNNNNLKEDIKYNKISDWKSNDKNQALEVGKPKRKRSIKRAIGRATRNYGRGMKKKLQQRYKAKGGMGRRAIRTMAGIYGATALTAAGGLVGITSGDFTKSIQYMAAGTAGGYTLGKRISNNAVNALKVDDTINELKKGYYADDYSKVEHKKNKEAFIKDENNIKRIEDKLKIERKEAKEIMEQHIKYYLDHDIYSIDDAIATYRLENEENMSRDKAIATAQYATQVMNGEDVNKMTAKRKKEYKDTFIPKFIEKGSKNPEKDVEKVFDNVSKFYLLKK